MLTFFKNRQLLYWHKGWNSYWFRSITVTKLRALAKLIFCPDSKIFWVNVTSRRPPLLDCGSTPQCLCCFCMSSTCRFFVYIWLYCSYLHILCSQWLCCFNEHIWFTYLRFHLNLHQGKFPFENKKRIEHVKALMLHIDMALVLNHWYQ